MQDLENGAMGSRPQGPAMIILASFNSKKKVFLNNFRPWSGEGREFFDFHNFLLT